MHYHCFLSRDGFPPTTLTPLSRMDNFITSVSNTLGQHLPGVLGAIVVFAIGYLLAHLLSAAISRGCKKLRIDERLEEKAGRDLKIGMLLSTVMFYLVLLYGTLVSLSLLGIQEVLDPAKDLVSRVVDIVPNVIAALFIGVAGYIVARILSGAAAALSSSLDGLATKAGFSADFKFSKLIGIVVFVLVLVPVLISALDTLRIAAISGPATAMLNDLLQAVPKIIGAALILVVAYIVGRFVCGLLADLLKSLSINTLPAKFGAESMFSDTSLSTVVGRVVLFFIMLGASLSALETLQLDRLAGVFDRLLVFSGQVVVGLLVIAVGSALANIASKRLHRDGKPTLTSSATRFAILGFVLAMGLRAMGIGEDIVNLAFGLTLGAIAVAVALSFGLGGREAAGKQMEHWLSKLRDPKE